MTDETVYVPKTLEYDEGEPLGVDGDVVAIIKSRPASRRITVLVALPAEEHGSDQDVSEGVTLDELADMGYRELQEVAKEHGIKANQSMGDLRDELREVVT